MAYIKKKAALDLICTIDATKLATDRHEASRGLFATAELGLLVSCPIEAARYDASRGLVCNMQQTQPALTLCQCGSE